MDEGLKKILLVTFSDNADHQDTLYGMYEQLIDIYNVYLLTINTPKVSVKKSDKTWFVDCPKRPGITKKTFDLKLLFSIIKRIRKIRCYILRESSYMEFANNHDVWKSAHISCYS